MTGRAGRPPRRPSPHALVSDPIVYDPRMIRFRLPLLAAVLLSSIAASGNPRDIAAEEEESVALLTLDGEAALRDRLWERVLLVTAKPIGEPMEDPALIPERFGQATRVTRDGKVEILTAAMLVENTALVRVTRTGGRPGEGIAKVGPTDEASLMARLECEGPCALATPLDAAPPEAWEPRRLLFFVLPGLPDQPVLSHVESLGRQGTPFESMIAVPGTVPPGTVLFDVMGRAVALTVRNSPTLQNRTLAAVMVLPKPDPASPAEPPAPGTNPETPLDDGRLRPDLPREKTPAPPAALAPAPPPAPAPAPEPAKPAVPTRKRPAPAAAPEPLYYPIPVEPPDTAPRAGSPR